MGFIFSLSAVVIFAAIPIVINILVSDLDPLSTSFMRLVISSVILFIFAGLSSGFRLPERRDSSTISLVLLAAAALTFNYITFAGSLMYISPTVSQVEGQLAPLFLIAGSIYFFNERISTGQMLGFALIITGLGIFFVPHLSGIVVEYNIDNLVKGAALMFAACIFWAFNGLILKKLISVMDGLRLLFLICLGSSIFLFPFVKITPLFALDMRSYFLLFLAANLTVFGYLSLTTAFTYWEGSRVGAVLSLIPLVTAVASGTISTHSPDLITNDHRISTLSFIGIVVVVTGSICTSVLKESNTGRIRQIEQ